MGIGGSGWRERLRGDVAAVTVQKAGGGGDQCCGGASAEKTERGGLRGRGQYRHQRAGDDEVGGPGKLSGGKGGLMDKDFNW